MSAGEILQDMGKHYENGVAKHTESKPSEWDCVTCGQQATDLDGVPHCHNPKCPDFEQVIRNWSYRH